MTQQMATNAPPDQNIAQPHRPATFDARVMAYLPGLYSLARRFGRSGDRQHELVQDTIMCALARWQSFREDGGMWGWLKWQMRGVISNAAVSAKRSPVLVDERHGLRVTYRPRQEDYAELSGVLRRMSGREADILVRRAMGDSLREIAADEGLSMERTRQLGERARVRLVGDRESEERSA